MKKEISRSQFIQRLSMLGLGAVGLGGVLSGCGSDNETQSGAETQAKTAAPDPCADLAGLTEADLNIRKTFEYVAETPIPEKLCDNCQFWTVPAAGSPCGGCQIIKGPIHYKGYCKQWVAKTA